jgi:ABC-type Mn2+/Zn2+ transport system permease subunit
VIAMPAVGAILAIALIAAPAAAARQVTRSIVGMLWLAPTFGVVSAVVGLYASRWAEISAGASIALVAALLFGICFVVRVIRERSRPRQAEQAPQVDTGLIRVVSRHTEVRPEVSA